MKLSKSRLREIIREVYSEMLGEGYFDDLEKQVRSAKGKERCPKGERRDPSTGRCTPVGKH